MDDYSGSNFLKENNARHLWHPMTDPKVNQKDSPMIISKGEGEYVWDVDGNKYLDVTGGLWNVNVGHNRQEIKEAIRTRANQQLSDASINRVNLVEFIIQ